MDLVCVVLSSCDWYRLTDIVWKWPPLTLSLIVLLFVVGIIVTQFSCAKVLVYGYDDDIEMKIIAQTIRQSDD